MSNVNGKQVVTTFRGGQFVIEDKRKKKAGTKKTEKKAAFEDMVQGTQDVPSWAVVPEASKFGEGGA